MDNLPFSELLTRFLKDNSISRKAFAEQIGVSALTVVRWCSGKAVPSRKHEVRINQLIGNSADSGPSKSLYEHQLPLAVTDFRALRQSGMIYVDKTAQIFEFAKDVGCFFINRPRRFGKSLLVSTLKYLFGSGLRDFRGLAIERLWKEEKTYPVVDLSLSSLADIRDRQSFEAKLMSIVHSGFSGLGFVYQRDSVSDYWDQLKVWLNEQPRLSLVLLIDEYDAGLTSNIDNPELFAEIRPAMQSFFNIIKECNGAFRLCFMTGITKYTGAGSLSPFNNFEDLSSQPAFSDFIGYTADEIRENFQPYLARAAAVLGETEESVLENMGIHYDGYCFDFEMARHVFCPWTVLQFLKNPQNGYLNYWYRSAGQPRALLNYIMATTFSLPDTFDSEMMIPEQSLYDMRPYKKQQPAIMLFHNGYLTVKKRESAGMLTLGYPNEEVRASLGMLYVNAAIGFDIWDAGTFTPATDALASYSSSQLVDYLNRFFNSVDYDHYPLTSEGAVRGLIKAFLLGARVRTSSEESSAKGRSDLEAYVPNRHWVFELKYTEKKADESALLQKAKDQINDREYGFSLDTRRLIRLAAVFNGKERKITAFAEVPLPA